MWTYSRVGPVKRRVLCMDCVSEKLPIWSLASDRLTAALTAALMEVIRMNMYGFTFKCHLQHTKAPKNGMRRAETEANKCCVHNPPAKESYKYFSFFFVSPRKKREMLHDSYKLLAARQIDPQYLLKRTLLKRKCRA